MPDGRPRFARTPCARPDSLKLALRFYDKLFREYALVDLKHYKSGQIAMRWRIEDEVIARKGELTCGGTRCEHHEPVFEEEEDAEEGHERPLVPVQLAPYQLDFAYIEDDQPKRALVKSILCESCAKKLTYKSRKDKEQLPEEPTSRRQRDDERREERRRSRSPKRRSERG